jgi:hypothetical protein
VLVSSSDTPATGSEPGWKLRLKVLCARRRLDRELANGRSPTDRRDLALRAEQLTDQRTRRGLAAMIENLLDALDEPPGLLERQATMRAVNRPALIRVRGELLALAATLVRGESIPALAAARAQLLICDDSSPLYGDASLDAAEASILAIRMALAIEPPSG